MLAYAYLALVCLCSASAGSPDAGSSDAPLIEVRFREQPEAIRYQHIHAEEETRSLQYQPENQRSYRSITRMLDFTSSIDRQGAIIKESVNAVRMELHRNDDRFVFDSENPEHDQLANQASVKAMLNAFTYDVEALLDGSGTPLKVLNGEHLAGLVQNTDHPDAKAYVGLMVSDKQVMHALRNRYHLLPEDPVAVGDSWAISHTLDQGETYVVREMRCELIDVRRTDAGRIAEISILGKEKYGFGEEYTKIPGTPDGPMFFKFYDVDGKLLFSLEDGLIDELRIVVSGSSYVYPPFDPDTLEPGQDRPKLTTETKHETLVRRVR